MIFGMESQHQILQKIVMIIKFHVCHQNIATGAPFKVCRRNVWNNIRFPYVFLYEDVAITYKLFLSLTIVLLSMLICMRIEKKIVLSDKNSMKKIGMFENL